MTAIANFLEVAVAILATKFDAIWAEHWKGISFSETELVEGP